MALSFNLNLSQSNTASNNNMESRKVFRIIRILIYLIIIAVVPGLVMRGEDGNLLVRVAMMAILAALFFGAEWLVARLTGRN